MTRVVVSGASGRMGREVVRAVSAEKDLDLVGAVDCLHVGDDSGVLAGLESNHIKITDDLAGLLAQIKPDVLVDFTAPAAVVGNVVTTLEAGVRPVVGTTGMSVSDLEMILDLSAKRKIGGLVAPNFAIGAVLMMRFAAVAAKYFPAAEIIELHHDQKVDAPSGTALQTAEMMVSEREDWRPNLGREELKLSGARGGEYRGGLRIHSVRLPGLVAHQEVLFGGQGQTLSIRHDSIARESFMPGVILGIRRAMGLDHMVYGLDKLIFESS